MGRLSPLHFGDIEGDLSPGGSARSKSGDRSPLKKSLLSTPSVPF
jgi:hypothetical protein